MSDPTTFERQLADGVDRLAGPTRPVDAMAIARTSIATTRGSRPLGLSRAVAIGVLGAVAVTSGGLALTALRSPTTVEPIPAAASATPVDVPTRFEAQSIVELPTEVPAGVRSGTLDTPLGPARWVHLQGDRSTLPDLDDFTAVALAGGYGVSAANGTWSSPDLVSWTLVQALPGLDHIGSTPGSLWFWNEDDDALVRSTGRSDPPSFVEYDLSRVAAERPQGLDWDGFRVAGGVVDYQGTIILLVRWEISEPAQVFGLPGGRWVPQQRPDGEVDLFEPFATEPFLTIRVDETTAGLRIIDTADGSTIAEPLTVGLDVLERWLARGMLYETGIVVIRPDGEIESSNPDWAQGAERSAFLATASAIHAYRPNDDGTVSVYALADDVTWSPVEIIGDEPDEPGPIDQVWGGGDSVTLANDDSYWSSSDGIEWKTSTEQSEPDITTSVGNVEIRGRDQSQPDTLRFITADDTTGEIDIAALGRGRRIDAARQEAGDSDVTVSGVEGIGENAIALTVRGGEKLDVWIIAFDPPAPEPT